MSGAPTSSTSSSGSSSGRRVSRRSSSYRSTRSDSIPTRRVRRRPSSTSRLVNSSTSTIRASASASSSAGNICSTACLPVDPDPRPDPGSESAYTYTGRSAIRSSTSTTSAMDVNQLQTTTDPIRDTNNYHDHDYGMHTHMPLGLLRAPGPTHSASSAGAADSEDLVLAEDHHSALHDHVSLQPSTSVPESIVDVTPNYGIAHAVPYPIAIATATKEQPFLQVHLSSPSSSSSVAIASSRSLGLFVDIPNPPVLTSSTILEVADDDLNSKQTPTSGSMVPTLARRLSRQTTACVRCRRLKQKCNGEKPACSQCKSVDKGRGPKQPCEYHTYTSTTIATKPKRRVDPVQSRLPSLVVGVPVHLNVNMPSPCVHSASAVHVSPAAGSYFPQDRLGAGMRMMTAAVSNNCKSEVSNTSGSSSSGAGIIEARARERSAAAIAIPHPSAPHA